MPLPVESAVVCLTAITYRRPRLARQVDVGSQGAVQCVVALRSLVPCQQAVSGVDCIAAVVLYEITQILCRAAFAAAVGPVTDGAACQFQSFGGDTDGVGVAAACL